MSTSRKESIRIALQAADDKKAEDPVALDLEGLSSVTDYFLVASGNSDAQVKAIADNVVEKLSENGVEPLGREGYNQGTWILLDYVDFVVHVFHRDKRMFYALENLWSDAPRLRVTDMTGGHKRKSRKSGEKK